MKIKVEYTPQYEQLEDGWAGLDNRYSFHCKEYYEQIPF